MTQVVLQWNFVKAFESYFTKKKKKKKEKNIKKKKFEKKQKWKASRTNNDNDVGAFAVLKYWRNEKMTLCVLIGHERQTLFWGIFIFIRRVPPSNLVVVTFLLTSLRNGYFLRRGPQRYRLLMAEIAVLIVFYIRLHASSRISMRNRLVYHIGRVVRTQCWHCIRGYQCWTAYNFSRINLKCAKFAFLIGYYVTFRYHIFLKQYKTAVYTIWRAKCD